MGCRRDHFSLTHHLGKQRRYLGRDGGAAKQEVRGLERGCGQTQAQQRVEKVSLAGGPVFPAFLLTLGSSRTKDMARAQW